MTNRCAGLLMEAAGDQGQVQRAQLLILKAEVEQAAARMERDKLAFERKKVGAAAPAVFLREMSEWGEACAMLLLVGVVRRRRPQPGRGRGKRRGGSCAASGQR
jgi:hypothetical protein